MASLVLLINPIARSGVVSSLQSAIHPRPTGLLPRHPLAMIKLQEIQLPSQRRTKDGTVKGTGNRSPGCYGQLDDWFECVQRISRCAQVKEVRPNAECEPSHLFLVYSWEPSGNSSLARTLCVAKLLAYQTIRLVTFGII